MDFNALITSAAKTGGNKLFISVDHSADGTFAEVTVFDNEGSYVTDSTLADAELTALKADLPKAEFF